MFSHKPSLSLTEAIEGFVTNLALSGRAKTTQELYRCLLMMLARSLGPVNVKAIHRGEVVAHLARLSENDSQAYVCLNVRVLRGFFSWLVGQGEIKTNPLEGMTVKEPPWTPVPPFTPEERQRLLDAARSPLEHVVVMLLLDTGLRASELTGLRLADIDLQANELTIHGKGGKERRVALNPEPRKALLAYFASQAQLDGLVWPEGWHRKRLSYLLDKLGRRAGVARVHAHRFRHTFASSFLRETGDALALKALLGHSSLIMVQRYTAALEEERAIEVHREHPIVA